MVRKYCTEIAVCLLAACGVFLWIVAHRVDQDLGVKKSTLESLLESQLKTRAYPDHGRPYGRNSTDFFSTSQSLQACEVIDRRDSEVSSELQGFIESGLDVNVKGKYGMTLLTWALYRGNFDAFRKLLDAGADPNVRFSTGFELHLVGWIDRDATVLTVANVIGEREFLDPNLFKGVQINQHDEAVD